MKLACTNCLTRMPKREFLAKLRDPSVIVRAVIEILPDRVETLAVDKEAIERTIAQLEVEETNGELEKGIICSFIQEAFAGVEERILYLGNVCGCGEEKG